MNNRPYELSDDVSSVIDDTASQATATSKSIVLLSTTTSNSKKNISYQNFSFSKSKTNIFHSEKEITFLKRKKTTRYFILFLLITISLSIIYLMINFLLSLQYKHPKTPELDILTSLTSPKPNAHKSFSLENNLNVTLISDDNSQISHVSISIDTSNDVNPTLFHKTLAMNLMLVSPLESFNNAKHSTTYRFNITKKEIVSGWTRVDFDIDSSMLLNCIDYVVKWINNRELCLNDVMLFKNSIQKTIYSDISHSEYFNNIDRYHEINILDHLLFKQDNEKFVTKTDFQNDTIFESLKKELNKTILNNYVANKINIILYDKSTVIQNSLNHIKSALSTIIPSNNNNITTANQLLFPELNEYKQILNISRLGQIIWMKSANIGRYLSLYCYLLNITNQNDLVYLDYIIYQLNSKHNNSLYFQLDNLHFIESLSVTLQQIPQLSSTYVVNILYSLTDLGALNIEDIIYLTVSTIQSFNSYQNKSSQVYEDFLKIKSIKIQFKEHSPYNLIDQYQEFYIKGLTFKHYKRFNISNNPSDELIEQFTPKNMLILYKSKYHNYHKMTIFNYDHTQILAKQSIFIGILHKTFEFYSMKMNPSNAFYKHNYENNLTVQEPIYPNRYITNLNSTVKIQNEKEATELTPEIIYQSNKLQFWYRTDRTFEIPQVNIYLNFITTYIRSDSAIEYFAHVLFFNSFQKRIENELYEAFQSGSTIDMHLTDNGMIIKLTSFSDVAFKILDRIFVLYFKPSISNEIYLQTKNNDFNYLSYYTLKQRGIMYFRRLLKFNKVYFVHDIDFKNTLLRSTIKKIPQHSIITSLIYGDINYKEISTRFERYRKLIFKEDNIELILGDITYPNVTAFLNALHFHKNYEGSYVFRKSNNEEYQKKNLLMNYYRIYPYNDQNNINALLLYRLMQGYISTYSNEVEFSLLNVDNYLYFYFGWENELKTPAEMNKDLDLRIKYFQRKLNILTIEEFQAIKGKLANDLKIGFNSLDQKANKVWDEIYRNSFNFKPLGASSFLMKLEKDDLKDFYKEVFAGENNNLRKLSIQLFHSELPFDLLNEEYYLNKNITTIVTDDINIFQSNDIILPLR